MKLKQKSNSYDLIISLGAACSCTQALRACELQNFSYPFDWVCGTKFIDRISILTNEFKDWFNIEDLEFMEYCELRDIYHNKKTGMIFNHDFPRYSVLETDYKKVQKKYNRRIKRLFRLIQKSNRILFVYIDTPDNIDKLQDNSVLVNGYNLLNQNYPSKDINLLYLNCGQEPFHEEQITNKILKITFDYKSTDDKAYKWDVNTDLLEELFSRYELNNKDFFKFKKIKKGIFIGLLGMVSTIFRMRFYLFGIRFDFCIGKIRD